MINPMWQQIEANWQQLSGQVKENWGKLTNDDIVAAQGEREQLIGRIQERYAMAREEARREVDEWANNLKEKI